jgi:hypothetical protein
MCSPSTARSDAPTEGKLTPVMKFCSTPEPSRLARPIVWLSALVQ